MAVDVFAQEHFVERVGVVPGVDARQRFAGRSGDPDPGRFLPYPQADERSIRGAPPEYGAASPTSVLSRRFPSPSVGRCPQARTLAASAGSPGYDLAWRTHPVSPTTIPSGPSRPGSCGSARIESGAWSATTGETDSWTSCAHGPTTSRPQRLPTREISGCGVAVEAPGMKDQDAPELGFLLAFLRAVYDVRPIKNPDGAVNDLEQFEPSRASDSPDSARRRSRGCR